MTRKKEAPEEPDAVTERVFPWLGQGEAAIERAQKSLSQQPRFSEDQAQAWFGTVYRFLKEREVEREDYRADSRKRDAWLREWSLKEPYWNAVLRSCAMLDANRGWSYIGGRNQTNRFTRILHEANDGQGWRLFAMQSSEAFRISDLGDVTEVGRDGQGGPVGGIYCVDSARCRLTGEIGTPLEYFPTSGRSKKAQKWVPDDFFRVVSYPSTDETLHGLGWCATSSAFELIVLLYGVLQHDEEVMGARMPRGLLFLQGIGQEQWDEALKARESSLDAKNRVAFGGVMVLATAGDVPPDAKLVALSQLPANFDRETFLEQTWYGYAAIVGRDPSEFFPVQTGSIGRGNEPDVQHRKATRKGGAEWPLAWQEQLQNELPPSLLFEFDEKDDEGELITAQVAKAWEEVYTSIYQAGGQVAAQPITPEQYLALLVEKQIVPPEWTEAIEDEKSTDVEYARKRYLHRLLERPDVLRAVETYPHEAIVRYHWNGFRATETVLWPSGAEALHGLRRWKGWDGAVRRQDDSPVLYDDAELDFTITEADVDRALKAGARMVGPGEDEQQEEPGLGALYAAQAVDDALEQRSSLLSNVLDLVRRRRR